jgi:hypothetical protein
MVHYILKLQYEGFVIELEIHRKYVLSFWYHWLYRWGVVAYYLSTYFSFSPRAWPNYYVCTWHTKEKLVINEQYSDQSDTLFELVLKMRKVSIREGYTTLLIIQMAVVKNYNLNAPEDNLTNWNVCKEI